MKKHEGRWMNFISLFYCSEGVANGLDNDKSVNKRPSERRRSHG
jgi:hypothetical protein